MRKPELCFKHDLMNRKSNTKIYLYNHYEGGEQVKRKYWVIFIVLLILLTSTIGLADTDSVYLIPVKGNINGVTQSVVSDGIKEAETSGASMIIFDIDTYGGFIHSAERIKNDIIRTNLPTISYVNNKAESAGVLIALASEKLVMSKTATIGSAETIPKDEKTLSLWVSILRDTAQHRNRDEQIAASMADASIEIKDVIEKGRLLNLTTREAENLEFIDYSADSVNDILKVENKGSAEIVEPNISAKNRIADILTNPIINTLLLIIGFVGAVVELFMPGFGLGGVLSILGFGLFFTGNIISGNAEWMSLVLFVLGGILIFIEMLIPGFGLPGISGIVLLVMGLVSAMKDITQGLVSLSIAVIIAAIVGIIVVKKGFESPLMKKVVLGKNLDIESAKPETINTLDLIGKEGKSMTILRPSGTINIDGVRYDALTEGDFIPQGADIKVIRVIGTKIFVRRA